MARFWLIAILIGLLASCGRTEHSPNAQFVPSADQEVNPSANEPTPDGTTTTVDLPTSFELVDAGPLTFQRLGSSFQIKRIDADPRWRELPNDVLMVVGQTWLDQPTNGLNYRDLGFYDVQGRFLFSPNQELEAQGWCSSDHSAYSPSAQWSDDGRWFLLGCQTEFERFRYATLDLERNQWLLITVKDMTIDDSKRDIGILLEHNQFWLIHAVSDLHSVWIYTFDPAIDHYKQVNYFATYQNSGSDALLHMATQPDGQRLFHARRASAKGLYLWKKDQFDGQALKFDKPLDLDDRFVWAENQETVLVYHTVGVSSTLQQIYELELDLTTQKVRLLNISDTWLAPPTAVTRQDYTWQLQLDGWHLKHKQQAVAFVPNSLQLLTAFGSWRKSEGQAWMCQVEQGVGANVLAFDANGQSTKFLHYPNVGFSYPQCASESPSGLIAVSLSNNQIVLVDANGQELTTIVGASRGWRPAGE